MPANASINNGCARRFDGLRQFYRFGAPKAPGTAAACASAGAAVLDMRVLLGRVLLLLLFFASVMKLSAQSFSPFLYFQF